MESRPWAFQRAIHGVRMLPSSSLKGGSKSDFFIFWVKVNGWSSQALSTQFAGECHKHLMVGGNVDHIRRRDLYSAARLSRRNCLITIWCGSVSSSGDSFFTLTFRALGAHCHDLGHDSRMTNEIECAQLHSELFRRRHSTQQSHGLFALAKQLYSY